MAAELPATLSIVKKIIQIDPRQAAMAFEEISPQDGAAILRELPLDLVSACFENLSSHLSAQILEIMPPEMVSKLIERLSPDHAADTFRYFSQEGRVKILEILTPEKKNEFQELLSYPEGSAGRLMRKDYISFRKDMTVEDVIRRLRTMGSKHSSQYSYVVDNDNKLIGVLNMRDLILADSRVLVENVMRREVFCVSAFMDREEVLHIVGQKHFLSVPVIDPQGRIVGLIKPEDLLESSQEEATEDIQLMFGASAEERVFSPIHFKVRKRLPWLYINLATAFLAASVVSLFEGTISRVAVLAVFLPVVAGQGGNSGTQSLVVVIRGLVMREIRLQNALHLISVETRVGLINGVLIGAVTAFVTWLWQGNPFLGLVIGLAMVVNMFMASLAGAGIPLLMKKLGFDPAQSSGIFLTTVTDVVGFSSFLGFATLFERLLI